MQSKQNFGIQAKISQILLTEFQENTILSIIYIIVSTKRTFYWESGNDSFLQASLYSEFFFIFVLSIKRIIPKTLKICSN